MTIETTRMFTVGRTRDRATKDAGWAGWYYKEPTMERIIRWVGNLAALALFAGVGVLLAWRG